MKTALSGGGRGGGWDRGTVGEKEGSNLFLKTKEMVPWEEKGMGPGLFEEKECGKGRFPVNARN